MMFVAAAMLMASMMSSMIECPKGRAETENKHSFQPKAQATAALRLAREALRPARSEYALAMASLDGELPVAVLSLLRGGIEGESELLKGRTRCCFEVSGTVTGGQLGEEVFCGGIKISLYFFIVFI